MRDPNANILIIRQLSYKRKLHKNSKKKGAHDGTRGQAPDLKRPRKFEKFVSIIRKRGS